MPGFRLRRWLRAKKRPLLLAIVVCVVVFGAYVFYLDYAVRDKFEGKRFELPARVYASPLEVYPGIKLSPVEFSRELMALGYQASSDVSTPGSYFQRGERFEVMSRPFTFWDGPQPALHFSVRFDGNEVGTLRDLSPAAQPLQLVRLDPLLIGGIYPAHNEDRILVKLGDVPPMLIKTLIAVEDRNFYYHHGVDPRGVARALLADLRGGTLQGGSTLTQQLVKNFYLTSERTLTRKVTEMIMAVLLELHYSKNDILETYLNEIYLGQDGNRAIHGFGLASQFYFDRPVGDLTLPQMALLVGLVKGPSYYDPRRHPHRALARRNLVLGELSKLHVIDTAQYLKARAAPLGVIQKAPVGTTAYPAFLDLVHRQLQRDYAEQDLRSEGLQIFTTLQPHVQRAAERALAARLGAIEKERGLPPKSLQGAVVVTSTNNGEVLAMVGGRNARFEGFNRALDASRPIGSLIKPALYLTALSQPDRYTLVTPIEDSPFSFKEAGAKEWTPQNYDRQFHGVVELRTALAQSYNIPAVRVGLSLGVSNVMATVARLGVDRELPVHAANLLGAVQLTPYEVAQMYETIASGGFRTPLRAIREVLTLNGTPLQRYSVSVDQVFDAGPVYLVTSAMQDVVREGTAANLKSYVSPDLDIAAKTGSSEDLRDSWFAGFSGDKLGVVWVGRDDDEPAKVTGASGAMTVWGDMMSHLNLDPLTPTQPDDVDLVWIDPKTGLRADRACAGAVQVPFIHGSAPEDKAPCAAGPARTIKSWFRRLFGHDH